MTGGGAYMELLTISFCIVNEPLSGQVHWLTTLRVSAMPGLGMTAVWPSG